MARHKVVWPLAVNVAAVALAGIGIAWMRRVDDAYFRVGPHADLTILSVKIDSWYRWYALVVFLGLMGLSDVLTDELAHPVLSFTIYNPDKRHIVEFDKNELQILANLTYLTAAIKRVLLVLVQISQFDLAVMHILITEIATVFTIRSLLNEKTFSEYAPLFDQMRS